MTDSSKQDLETALGGQFHVYRELGRGGFGAVYEAEPAGEPGTKVALKVLERPPGMGSQFEERFLREVRNAQRVRHPYAVRIFEYGAIPDGRLFYTMELCQGPSLRDLDTPPASVAGPRLVRVVTQALEALDAAHALGMVHRDMKPDNVHVVPGPDGTEVAKVLDFGLAKIGNAGRASQELTADGQILGTLEYMPPEQLMGQPLDGRADLYSTGVMLYELLCGQRPFDASDDRDLIRGHLAHQPPPLLPRAPARVTQALEAVVMRALAKDPAQRFESARAMAEALLEAVPAARAPVRFAGARPSPSPSPAPPAAIPPTRVGSAPDPAAEASPGAPRAVPPTRVAAAGATPTRRSAPAVSGPGDPSTGDAVSQAVIGAPPTRPLPGPAPRADGLPTGAGSEALPLGGRYVLRRLVSETRRARTYEGIDRPTGQAVCVKVLRGHGAAPDGDMRRYLRGIDALSRVRHRHVVELLGGGVTPEGKPYSVMEWVPGLPLSHFLRRGRVPLPEAAGAACQVLEGLSAAHAAGVVHRDVSPRHVLVVPTDESAVVKLFGFGIAKALLGEDGTATRWGLPVGTPRYMSPEQLMGKRLDARADMFSVGVVLYEMVAGCPPHPGEEAVEVARVVLTTPTPPLPANLDAGERAALGPILDRALARDVQQRFPSADAMREALLPLAGPLAVGDFEGLEAIR